MNYTENYHLPQWKKEDRIMMEDFNQAMSTLDNGLAACRDAAEAGGAQAKSALYAGLFRLAYNHWHAAAVLESFPTQAGAFRQSFAQGDGGKMSGAMQLEDCAWLVNGSETLSIGHITPTLNKGNKISAPSGGSGSMNAYFTSPYGGRLTGVTIRAHCEEIRSSVTMQCTFELRAKDRLLGQATGTMSVTKTGYATTDFPVSIPIHAKERHTLTVRVSNIGFTGTIEVSGLAVTGYKTPSAYTTCKLQSEEGGLDGIALVHYESCGTESELFLQWDGKTLAPRAIRTITSYLGRKVQEAEFRMDRAVPASSELRLTVTCGDGGDIALFDWGTMLI